MTTGGELARTYIAVLVGYLAALWWGYLWLRERRARTLAPATVAPVRTRPALPATLRIGGDVYRVLLPLNDGYLWDAGSAILS